LRIVEAAVSVRPPRNQGGASQLTWLKSTDVVTVIWLPDAAEKGSGVTLTVTGETDTLDA
jgi:hypothetical protein